MSKIENRSEKSANTAAAAAHTHRDRHIDTHQFEGDVLLEP